MKKLIHEKSDNLCSVAPMTLDSFTISQTRNSLHSITILIVSRLVTISILLISMFLIQGCEDKQNDIRKSSFEGKFMTDEPAHRNKGIRANHRLPLDEWYRQYQIAWRECYTTIPQVQMQPINYFNPDADIENYSRLSVEHDRKVISLMQRKYPDLCAYMDIPEYAEYANQQRAMKTDQILEQGKKENEELQKELEQQVERNDREIKQQKEENERRMRSYSPPRYGY